MKKIDVAQFPESIEDKIALFTCATENYVDFSIICFQTFKEKNPGAFDFFLIGHSLSDHSIRKLNANHITYIAENLYKEFAVEEGWPYPSECLWLYKGPVIFHRLHYRYSIFMDPDNICNKKLPLGWLEDVDVIAAAVKHVSAREFLKILTREKFEILASVFDLKDENIDAPAYYTGLLFFNNKNYVQKNIYDISIKYFNKSKAHGIPRKGGDSLLSLMISTTNLNYYAQLPIEWQHLISFHVELDLDNAWIIHCFKPKPWLHNASDDHQWKFVRSLWKEASQKVTGVYDLFWYRGDHYNFGDEITPWLFHKMFGIIQKDPCEIQHSGQLVLLATGSIMRLSSPHTEVWGSGIRNIDQNDFTRANKYHAVRGPFTRTRLQQLGFPCPEIYGDPALLLPGYYLPDVPKKYNLGIIPHVLDYEDLKSKFSRDPEVLVIDLKTNDIESVVRDLLSCRHTISTSLHGLIVSVAYGIPTRWLKCSDRIYGDDIKFYDFFASIDREVFTQFDANTMQSHNPKYNPLKILDGQLHIPEKSHPTAFHPDELIQCTIHYTMKDIDLDLLLQSCPLYLPDKHQMKKPTTGWAPFRKLRTMFEWLRPVVTRK